MRFKNACFTHVAHFPVYIEHRWRTRHVYADSLGIDCHADNAIISISSVMSLNTRILFSQKAERYRELEKTLWETHQDEKKKTFSLISLLVLRVMIKVLHPSGLKC